MNQVTAWLTFYTPEWATQFSIHELVEKTGTQGVALLQWLAMRVPLTAAGPKVICSNCGCNEGISVCAQANRPDAPKPLLSGLRSLYCLRKF